MKRISRTVAGGSRLQRRHWRPASPGAPLRRRRSDAEAPLTVWVMGDSGEELRDARRGLHDETGIEVEVVAIPWDSIDEKLTTAVASGSGPDVAPDRSLEARDLRRRRALLEPLDDVLGDHPALDARELPRRRRRRGIDRRRRRDRERAVGRATRACCSTAPTSSPRPVSTRRPRRGTSCARTPRRSPPRRRPVRLLHPAVGPAAAQSR